MAVTTGSASASAYTYTSTSTSVPAPAPNPGPDLDLGVDIDEAPTGEDFPDEIRPTAFVASHDSAIPANPADSTHPARHANSTHSTHSTHPAHPTHSANSGGSTESASSTDSAASTNAVDDDDFREFVSVRWSALLRTAYLLTGDRERAEDLVQSALVRTHRHWSKINREGVAEAYVRKTMVNLNTDWWRRLGSREHRVVSVPDYRVAVDAYAAFELRDELWTALRRLPARMRAALVLRYFEDLSEADTAAVLGCSVGSVKSQCSRGLERLRIQMGKGSAE